MVNIFRLPGSPPPGYPGAPAELRLAPGLNGLISSKNFVRIPLKFEGVWIMEAGLDIQAHLENCYFADLGPKAIEDHKNRCGQTLALFDIPARTRRARKARQRLLRGLAELDGTEKTAAAVTSFEIRQHETRAGKLARMDAGLAKL